MVLIAIGLCALIFAHYYEPFEAHVGMSQFGASCTLREWWWPVCKGRFYATVFEVIAVVAFSFAGLNYKRESG